MAEVLETKVVCKQTGKYIGWPTVVRGNDGVLYAMFSGDRDGHVCPFGKNYLMRSEDQGCTWASPQMVNDTPLDDRDTGLCVCPDGTLVMTWFTSFYYGRYAAMHAHQAQNKQMRSWDEWERTIKAVTPELAEQWAPIVVEPEPAESQRWKEWARELGVDAASDFEDNHFPPATRRLGYWTRRSRDGGRTWDAPTQAPVSAPHGANLMPNGDLIYIGTTAGVDHAGKHSLGVALSSDQGVTWTLAARINASPQVPGTVAGEQPQLCEPHVVATASGKLLGLARFQVKDVKQRVLWQFESLDGGKTWTEPASTQLMGFPPHLLRRRDDRILVAHAIRHQPPGQRFCLSADEGLTWDVANQLTLQDAPDGDLGYPSSVELDDGTLLSVYYQKERAGEKPCLMMTRWRA